MRRGEGIGARATWSIRDIVIAIVLAVLSIVFLGLSIILPAVEVFGEDTSGARADTLAAAHAESLAEGCRCGD